NGEGALEMDERVGYAFHFAVAGDGLVTGGEQVSRTLREGTQFLGADGAHEEHAGRVILEDHLAVHGGEHGIDVDAIVGVDVTVDKGTHAVSPGSGNEHTGLAADAEIPNPDVRWAHPGIIFWRYSDESL